jgi:hypothetical protein
MLRLESQTQVLLVSVAKDPKVERFWSRHQKDDLPSVLSELGIAGITVPNFSFFEDAPRIHNIWNRWRMIRVAERLSEAGLAVIPHLNALETSDWDFWTGFLREHPHITCIAKEFQTGNRKIRYAREAIDDLRSLEQRLGRSLHPILIGASFAWGEAKASLKRVTLVDSSPFLKTVHRQELVINSAGIRKWHLVRTDKDTLLDARLVKNIETYAAWARNVRPKHVRVPRQQLLRLGPIPSDKSLPVLASIVTNSR